MLEHAIRDLGCLEVRPMELVLDGWRVYVDRTGSTVAVSSPDKPAEVPSAATRVYLSPPDYEALKLDVLRPADRTI
ncbi:MAG: hypothetical protein ACKO0Z_12915 [Betaproteobacteria bacterium]